MKTDYTLGAARRLFAGAFIVVMFSIPALADSIDWLGTIGGEDQYLSTAPSGTDIQGTTGLIQPSSLPLTVSNNTPPQYEGLSYKEGSFPTRLPGGCSLTPQAVRLMGWTEMATAWRLAPALVGRRDTPGPELLSFRTNWPSLPQTLRHQSDD